MSSTAIEDDYFLLTDQIEKKVSACLDKAEQKFGQNFGYQAIEINIRGRAAGQIRYGYAPSGSKSRTVQNLPILRFNPYLLTKYKETFIDQVVPHECAHLIAYAVYGMKIKPHGTEWKALMVSLFNQEPSVTHCFEVPQKVRRLFNYRCGCIDLKHQLTAIRHNKIIKQKAVYQCKKCRIPLEFHG
jgi:SprT protein